MLAAALGGPGADMWRVYAVAADPNRHPRDREGVSPLQAALRYPDRAIAELTAATLISNAANPNPPTQGDSPPLHIAAERGSLEMVEMLIRLGADPEAFDLEGRTPIQVAEAAGQRKAVALLRRHQEIARTHSSSRTAYNLRGKKYEPVDISDVPLLERRQVVGSSHGDLGAVRQAVDRDPRLCHSVATTSEICVEACAHTGRKPIAEYLLEKGAPYSLPTAVMMGDIDRARQLLNEDPLRIHERGAHDFALLWYPVIGRCNLEMTELLLQRGARVEEQHFLGTTALHWASMRGPIELVELLIENGADVNRRGRKFTAEGETPLQSAEGREQPEIAALLRRHGAK